MTNECKKRLEKKDMSDKKERLLKNLIDQVKEAQIKLGYVKETMRFYYPVSSLNALLGTEIEDSETMLLHLQKEMKQPTVLGMLLFHVHEGRIEISVPSEGVEYVCQKVEKPEFLTDLIHLFERNHHCSIEDICELFRRYSNEFVCEKMPEGTDFDYVVHFLNGSVDEYYYCVKMEMGHTIYHRFMKEDYLLLQEKQ